MPAYSQQSSAPAIDVDTLTLRPRFSSLIRLTNFSALSRSSKTAAHVVTSVRPSTTAWKSGPLSRDQCANGLICRDGRIAPPCRASPRLTGPYSMAICRNRRSPSSAFSCLNGPLHAIANTMKSSSKLSALPNRWSVLVIPCSHPAKAPAFARSAPAGPRRSLGGGGGYKCRFLRRRAAPAESDVGLRAGEVVAQPLENRRHDRVVAMVVAADAGADRDDRVDPLLDRPDQPDDLLGARHRHFDLDDGREDFLVEDVLANRAGGHVAHQRGDRVLLLERHAGRCQRATHVLNVAEAHAHARPSELDREADIARPHAAGHVVGLDLFSAAPLDARGLVRHARIRKSAADDARPGQLVGLEGGGRADVRLRFEADAHGGEHPPHGAHQRGIEMLLAEAVEAGVALHAFVAVDRRALQHWVYIDRTHRAHIRAVAAGDALLRVDLHGAGPIIRKMDLNSLLTDALRGLLDRKSTRLN